MKTTFETTTPQGKIKAFNGKKAANGTFKDLKGLEFKATDLMVYTEEVELDGVVKQSPITVIYADNGMIYGGVSATIQATASDLIDLLKDIAHEGDFTLRITSQQSKAGREFLNLQLVDL